MSNGPKTISIDLRNKSFEEVIAVLNAIIAARATLLDRGKQLTIKRSNPAKTP